MWSKEHLLWLRGAEEIFNRDGFHKEMAKKFILVFKLYSISIDV